MSIRVAIGKVRGYKTFKRQIVVVQNGRITHTYHIRAPRKESVYVLTELHIESVLRVTQSASCDCLNIGDRTVIYTKQGSILKMLPRQETHA